MEQMVLDPDNKPSYSLRNGLLRHKDKIIIKDIIIIGEDEALGQKILATLHDCLVGGHLRIQNTYRKVRQLFFWLGLRRKVMEYVKGYDTCNRCKHENIHPQGLLQPLPVPDQAWTVLVWIL